MIRAAALAIVLATLLAGCGGTVETPGEPLRLLRESLPQAFVGEPYQATLRAIGGLRPFTFTLSDGELPPGIEIANGVLVGTPTAVGSYDFTLTVSDASLNTTFEEYAVRVVEIPPPSLAFNAPATEVPRRVTLRVVLDGRDVRALRTQATWDAERFALVDGSLTHPGDLAVFTTSEPGLLQADVAALGAAITGTRQVFSFDLEPLVDAPLLRLGAAMEFLAGGRHFYQESVEGAPGTPDEPLEDPDAGEAEPEPQGNDEPGDDPDGGAP